MGMSFLDCGLALGSAAVDGSGNAAFLVSGPADVGRAYRAFYAGGSGLAPSHSDQVTPSITPATTGILAEVSPAQPMVGDVIYIVIQVGNLDTDVVPFGSVSLSILNTNVFATAALNADGFAAFALTGAPAGTYTGRLDYYDDTGPLRGSGLPPDFQPSEAMGTITVAPKPTTATGTTPPPPPSPPAAQPVSPPKAVPAVGAAALTGLASAEAAVLHRRGLAAAARRAQGFTAAAAGTLRETITVSGARTSKVTLLASGKHVYPAAGSGRLRLQLTAAGRRAVRRKSLRRVTLTVQFTPLQGTAVSVSRTVKLPRR
jgi:hypothetical protein